MPLLIAVCALRGWSQAMPRRVKRLGPSAGDLTCLQIPDSKVWCALKAEIAARATHVSYPDIYLLPVQNPTDDVIDVKLRQFKLYDAETFTFGQLAHIW